MIRIVVADDQALIRSAVATTLGLEDDLEVVGQADTCGGVVEEVTGTQPDVVLLDVQMPAGGLDVDDAIAIIPTLRRVAPGVRIVVVTTFSRPGYLRRAMEAGASGFMVKDAPAHVLIEAVRRAAAGLRVVDPDLAAASLSMGSSPLTDKEREVLAQASRGLTTTELARAVFLSEGTVRNYLSSAIGKLGARNRAEAIRLATESGWL